MFEQFTKQAVNVCKISHEEAKNLHHAFVDINELLLGLLSESTSGSFKILSDYGITLEKARKIINEINIPDKDYVESDSQFSIRVKNILKNSAEQAKKCNVDYVNTEIILLSLLNKKLETKKIWPIFKELKIDTRHLKILTLRKITFEPEYDSISIPKKKIDTITKSKKKIKNVFSLEKFTTNLNKEAIKGTLDPMVGRKNEINRVIEILARRRKNNPILIGEAGVGKTAIAEGLAQLIIKGQVPSFLSSKKIISLNLSSVLSDTKYNDSFETRLNNIMNKVKNSPNIILFIDEIHTLVGTKSSEGTTDAANLLKPLLARGGFQCIGATTNEEYNSYIKKDLALERRFNPVNIPESTINETIQILRGLKSSYENYHGVEISDGVCIAAAKLSAQYITNRFLPDKAIDLIDEGCSRVRLTKSNVPEIIKVADQELQNIILQKNLAILEQRFMDASHLRAQELEIITSINVSLRLQDQMNSSNNTLNYKPIIKIKKSDIENIVTVWTGIPVGKITKNEAKNLIKLEEHLGKRIIGQEAAISIIAKAVRRARVGLKDKNRPIASFIFAGPTGVGKTELAKALASHILKSENSMIRFDMSEYMDRINVSKLIGSPPGYVGYEEGGILSEKISKEPYTLVLFDEIEKAHSDIFNILLQILDEGRLTDSKGSLINFKNTIIILTSNLGANIIQNAFLSNEKSLDFHSKLNVEIYDKLVQDVHNELKKSFKPEFLNRLDDIIIFEPLKKNDVRKILDILIAQLIKKVKSLGIYLTILEEVKNKLARDGFNPLYGARPLRRAIANSLENLLTDILLKKSFIKGTNLLFSLDEKLSIISTVTGITLSKKNGSNNITESYNLPIKLITSCKSSDSIDTNRKHLINFINEKKRKNGNI